MWQVQIGPKPNSRFENFKRMKKKRMSKLDPLDPFILNLALKHPNLPITWKLWGSKKVEKLYKIVMMEMVSISYHYNFLLANFKCFYANLLTHGVVLFSIVHFGFKLLHVCKWIICWIIKSDLGTHNFGLYSKH
jgi:hypothetical protein